MMGGMEGVRPEQGPPLSIPASFYGLIPLAFIASGALLLAEPAPMLSTRYSPSVLVAAHLGTLGLLGSAMLGSLYQMIPVVAGAPVPARRLAHAVHALWTLGLGLWLVGVRGGPPWALHGAIGLLSAAVVAFLVPTAKALLTVRAGSDTVHGLRLALLGLASVVGLGVTLTATRIGWLAPRDPTALLYAHVVFGLCAWVGGLVASVSFQVLPMFYLADGGARPARLGLLALIALGWAGAWAGVVAGAPAKVVALLGSPAALAVWLVHPAWAARALSRRRRKRADVSVTFWWAGLACGPLALVLGALAWWAEEPRFTIAFGWAAIWGWGGLIVHGMLTRIVPFLVWFHRYAALAGIEDVPPMRRLVPDGQARAGLALHVAALVVGGTAIAFEARVLYAAAGGLLVATGVVVARWLVGAFRHVARRETAGEASVG